MKSLMSVVGAKDVNSRKWRTVVFANSIGREVYVSTKVKVHKLYIEINILLKGLISRYCFKYIVFIYGLLWSIVIN